MTELDELRIKCASYENIIEGFRRAHSPYLFMSRVDTMMRTAVSDGVPVSVEKATEVFREI